MYVSERVKEQLRMYEGQAIELDALEVTQPVNPGDGLIRKLKVLGPAPPNKGPFTFDDIKLDAQPMAASSEVRRYRADAAATPKQLRCRATGQCRFLRFSLFEKSAISR